MNHQIGSSSFTASDTHSKSRKSLVGVVSPTQVAYNYCWKAFVEKRCTENRVGTMIFQLQN